MKKNFHTILFFVTITMAVLYIALSVTDALISRSFHKDRMISLSNVSFEKWDDNIIIAKIKDKTFRLQVTPQTKAYLHTYSEDDPSKALGEKVISPDTLFYYLEPQTKIDVRVRNIQKDVTRIEEIYVKLYIPKTSQEQEEINLKYHKANIPERASF